MVQVEFTRKQVENTSFDQWYQRYKRVTIRSRIIKLPQEFINYLLSDGIILPIVPPGITLSVEDPRFDAPSYDECVDSSDEDVWAISDDDNTKDINNNFNSECNINQSPVSASVQTEICFPVLEREIQSAIDWLGGTTFPKLNWSAPRDSKWLTGSLKCTTPGDVYMMLKSSDFCCQDCKNPFKYCSDGIDLEQIESQVEPLNQLQMNLVLRRWGNLKSSMEFRCFVKDYSIVAISQRHYSTFFSFLTDETEQDRIQTAILIFYRENISSTFPDPNFAFDVYIDKNGRVYLIDFGVWGDITDPLLFTWNELANIQLNSIVQNTEKDATKHVEFRVLEEIPQMIPSNDCYYGLPKDVLDKAVALSQNDTCHTRDNTELSSTNSKCKKRSDDFNIDLSSAEGIDAFATAMKKGNFDNL